MEPRPNGTRYTDVRDPFRQMGLLTTAELVEAATASAGRVMEIVKSKLDKDEIASIGLKINILESVLKNVALRLTAAEQRVAVAKERAKAAALASQSTSARTSASILFFDTPDADNLTCAGQQSGEPC